MLKHKILIAAAGMLLASPAFAQGWSSEADMSQGIRNGNIAFTNQMQNRGFFAIPGFFAPGMTNGYLGSRAYRGKRFTGAQASTTRPARWTPMRAVAPTIMSRRPIGPVVIADSLLTGPGVAMALGSALVKEIE